MICRRESYIKQLAASRHNGLVKVITGLRRVGKSFLLFRLYKDYLLANGVEAGQILEISLDKPKNRRLLDPLALGEAIEHFIASRKGMHYVFIDEVQLALRVLNPDIDIRRVAPEDRASCYVSFYDVLNGLLGRPDVDVYVTGSNSKFLSRDVATNFRGRGHEIRLHPFSFSEYLETTGESEADGLENYLVWGGMPLAVLEKDRERRSRYLKDLFLNVYVKDICERHGIADDLVLDMVIDVLCSSVGSLTNVHKLVTTLASETGTRTTDITLKKYLDHLLDAFLFSCSRRYDVRGRRYLSRPEKYYCEDLGLRNARLDLREIEGPHLMENAIYNELVRRGFNVDVGVVEIMEKSGSTLAKRQHEIDFIVNSASRKIYIQSAFRLPNEEKTRQEVLPLCNTGDNFRKIVVTYGMRQPNEDNNGILYAGLVPFLLDEKVIFG